tara:strand:- start:133 stop:363 length:231 start_codon:yes stop_codon:yes gene_type:complete
MKGMIYLVISHSSERLKMWAFTNKRDALRKYKAVEKENREAYDNAFEAHQIYNVHLCPFPWHRSKKAFCDEITGLY